MRTVPRTFARPELPHARRCAAAVDAQGSGDALAQNPLRNVADASQDEQRPAWPLAPCERSGSSGYQRWPSDTYYENRSTRRCYPIAIAQWNQTAMARIALVTAVWRPQDRTQPHATGALPCVDKHREGIVTEGCPRAAVQPVAVTARPTVPFKRRVTVPAPCRHRFQPTKPMQSPSRCGTCEFPQNALHPRREHGQEVPNRV